MKRPRYNKIPRCPHGHLRIPGNLIRHGTQWECRTCAIQARERYVARKQSQAVLAALEES